MRKQRFLKYTQILILMVFCALGFINHNSFSQEGANQTNGDLNLENEPDAADTTEIDSLADEAEQDTTVPFDSVFTEDSVDIQESIEQLDSLKSEGALDTIEWENRIDTTETDSVSADAEKYFDRDITEEDVEEAQLEDLEGRKKLDLEELFADSSIGYRESYEYQLGLNSLPQEALIRYQSLAFDSTNEDYKKYFREGDLAIFHLGRTLRTLDGEIPDRDHPQFPIYDALEKRIINVIDRISLHVIYEFPEIDVDSLLRANKRLRQRLERTVTDQRGDLIEDGLKLLQEYRSDESFTKYPHRREALAGLYYRLAELMYQEAYDRFLIRTDVYIQKLDSLSEADPSAISRLSPPQPDYSRVKLVYQRVVDEFPTSVYADDAFYNVGYLTYQEATTDIQKRQANRIFETLLKIYPTSEYTLNCLRRVAEYYFMPPVNNLEKSVEYYTRIKDEFRYTEFYQEALYKLGWTYYRMSELAEAVEYFADVLDYIYERESAGLPQASQLDIAEESINYIGICYAVDRSEWPGAGINNMVRWLDENPERKSNYGRALILQLGEIFRNQIGQYMSAVETYDKYIELFPMDPQTPEVQLKIIDIFQQGEIYDPQGAHLEKVEFYEQYNPDSEWWTVNEDSSLRKELIPELEKYLDLIIEEKLVLAVENDDQEELEAFEKYCRQYLRFWTHGPNAYKLHYKLATALEKRLDRPTEAMREYWQVVTTYDDTAHQQLAAGRIVAIGQELTKREAASAIYVSPEGKILPPEMKPPEPKEAQIDTFTVDSDEQPTDDSESETEQPEEGMDESESDTTQSETPTDELTADSSAIEDSLAAQDSPAVEDSLAAADSVAVEKEKEKVIIKHVPMMNSERILFSGFDLYIGLFPESENTPIMLFQAGDKLFEHNKFEESRAYLDELINNYPQHNLVEDAYRIYLEGYFISKQYDEVEEVYDRIAAADISEDLKKEGANRKAQSLYLYGKDLIEENDHIKAAEKFKRVALETPDFEEADRALFLAGQEYREAEAFDEAIEAFIMLVEKYPDSERADKALYNVGFDFKNAKNDPKSAAQTFERLVNEYPESELVQNALANASAYYGEVDDHRAVIRVNEEYVRRFPNAADADVYLFENAEHYMKLDEIEKANEIYQRFARKYPNDPRTVQAYFERGGYYVRNDNISQAKREFSQTVDAHERLVREGGTGNPRYASKALAQLIDWEHEEYNELQYRLPPASAEAARERKKEWRNELTEEYQKLVSFNQKEGYQAFYKMGRLDEELALSRFNQNLPNNLTLEEEITQTSTIVDESILLNNLASQTYRDGLGTLRSILEQLDPERERLQQEYTEFNDTVINMQKENTEGLPDSMAKLDNLSRSLAEIDSAVTLAHQWSDSCTNRIPDIASRNGDYLKRLWRLNLTIRGNAEDEEIQMLFREEILNSAIAPIAREICGLYLRSLNVAREFEKEAKYLTKISDSTAATIETLTGQYVSQAQKARNRIDRFTGHYVEMLPEGPDALSPDGFYPDEMGFIIQDQLDYLNTFTMDLLGAFAGVMDTISSYDTPYGFAGDALDNTLQFVVDQHDVYREYAERSEEYQEEYSNQYYETDAIRYDDAAIAFEDFAIYSSDYDVALLEGGLRIKKEYDILGPAGIEIMSILIKKDPETYGTEYGLGAETTAIATSSEWLIYPEFIAGFEMFDFDDEEWRSAKIVDFPADVDLGVLDSLGAKAIWYYWDEIMKADSAQTDTAAVDSVGAEEAVEDTLGADTTGQAADEDLTSEEFDDLFMRSEETEDTLGTEQDSLAAAEGDTLEAEDLAEADSDTLTEEAIEDTVAIEQPVVDEEWQFWMGVDSVGARKYFFRKSFEIDAKPTTGTIWITADDNFSLFVNEVYIAADDRDTIDWHEVRSYDLSSYLQRGENLIAVGTSDVDSTGYGLAAGLIYESIRNIDRQIDEIIERERERQGSKKPEPEGEPKEIEVHFIRTVEKNKLR